MVVEPFIRMIHAYALTSALSPRVGDYQFHPYWNLLIDQLWVR